MRNSHRRRICALFITVASLAAIVVGAPAAQAGPLVRAAASCSDVTVEQPFARWLDFANYVLAPDGTVEAGAADWSLSDASVVSGNEPYYVHGADESHSLALPPGSSATTRPMCVGIEYPTLRFFARNQGSGLSRLKVEALYEAAGEVRTTTIGTIVGGQSWQPTAPVPVLANLLALPPGGHTAVAFRFSPEGDGDWRIDDVYVDPFYR
jgi:hypothetical protein